MSVTVAPPGPPDTDEERHDPPKVDRELELLIEEARARARRRRLVYAAIALVTLGGAAAYVGGGGGGDSGGPAVSDDGRPGSFGSREEARLVSAALPAPTRTWSLAVHPRNPKILYALTLRGVFKSSDGAGSWRNVLPFGQRSRFGGGGSLAISRSNPSTTYAGTQHGIYKTSDGGVNWNPINVGNVSVRELKVDPARTQIVYAETGRDGLLQTTNGGGSWRRVGASLPLGFVNEFAVDPSDSQTLYAAMGDGTSRLYVSRDGGRNWRERPIPRVIEHISLAFDPHEPGTVYAGAHEGIFKSRDHGASWQAVNTQFMTGEKGAAETPLAFNPAKRGTIYAQTYCKGVFKSLDGGESWRAANIGLQTACRPPYDLTLDPRHPATIYALVSIHGIYKSVDAARSWQLTAQPSAR